MRVAPESVQLHCAYPALAPPVDVPLFRLPDHPCMYLPGRIASDRAIWARSIQAQVYEQFMDAGFRRSGKLIYQPVCRGCRACIQIRVPVADFRPDKSQRRCARRNVDLAVPHHAPAASDEKFDLYRKYLRDWHGREDVEGRPGFEAFLYDSPVPTTIEFEYRDAASRLLAVGICDVCPRSLSSVYFYFDPDHKARGLGTLGVLQEIAFAQKASLPYYYLGYWIAGCRAMEYKNRFRPNEVLGTDGTWRPGCAQNPADVGVASGESATHDTSRGRGY